MKSHVNSPKNGLTAVRYRECILYYWCVWKWVATGDCIDNIQHNAKVIEQYLTKQPRWSSDVIKALHQEVLLLGAVSRSFLPFSIHFRKQALTVWFNTIKTYINWISSLYRCIFHSLNKSNKSITHITVAVNKSLLINLKKKGFILISVKGGWGVKKTSTTTNEDSHFLVIYSGFSQGCTLCMIMWAMCRVFTSAAWCYQKINPPMEHFKVRAMPRLQLITFKITSPFKKRHCWATHDWRWGCCRDTTERTTVHQQKQGWKQITNETTSERLVKLHEWYGNIVCCVK